MNPPPPSRANWSSNLRQAQHAALGRFDHADEPVPLVDHGFAHANGGHDLLVMLKLHAQPGRRGLGAAEHQLDQAPPQVAGRMSETNDCMPWKRFGSLIARRIHRPMIRSCADLRLLARWHLSRNSTENVRGCRDERRSRKPAPALSKGRPGKHIARPWLISLDPCSPSEHLAAVGRGQRPMRCHSPHKRSLAPSPSVVRWHVLHAPNT